jgi:ADP-ribosylglycohydrolase
VGALAGAIAGASRIPPRLIEGLHAREELELEINEFVDLAIAKIKARRLTHHDAASL